MAAVRTVEEERLGGWDVVRPSRDVVP